MTYGNEAMSRALHRGPSVPNEKEEHHLHMANHEVHMRAHEAHQKAHESHMKAHQAHLERYADDHPEENEPSGAMPKP